jgi:outer membrane biosynthesis protein TonB
MNAETGNEDLRLRTGLRLSLMGHGALAVLLCFQTLWYWFFPTRMDAPSLRVDIVDLPDTLKKDLEDAWIAPEKPSRAKAAPTQDSVELTDEMVLKPKKGHDKNNPTKPSKLQSILKKFENVSPDPTEDEAAEELEKRIHHKPIRGNQLSQGNSLSGDAREGGPAGYPEMIKVKLRLHWQLPIWLKRQNLSAQVRILIDSQGRIVSKQFVTRSGNDGFDEYVERALNDSQPLPAPPTELVSTLMSRGILVGFPL